MRILLATSSALGALLIRALTWSRWSHAALLIDDRRVVEAVWPRVRISLLSDVIARHTAHALIELPCGDPEKVIDAALSQVSRPYDVAALFSLLIHRDWQDNDRWFCSELVAWAFDQGGSPLFRPEAMHRVTPEHLWMLAPRIPGRSQ